uniref:Wall-associated receptor kinase C-terminal domain-containing protein n=1 Tax=Aegilops tauschii subsp. strangulata TaxID=200361 RepID=A0A453DUT3_AEGTS
MWWFLAIDSFFSNNCSCATRALWLNNCSGTWSVHLGGRYEAAASRPAECKYSLVPVLPGAELTAWADYAGIVRRGFLLEWTVPGDCAACTATGGRCRFEAGANAFGCLCTGGRMHPATCGELLV